MTGGSGQNVVRYTLLDREGYLFLAAAIVEMVQGELLLENLTVDGNGGILID